MATTLHTNLLFKLQYPSRLWVFGTVGSACALETETAGSKFWLFEYKVYDLGINIYSFWDSISSSSRERNNTSFTVFFPQRLNEVLSVKLSEESIFNNVSSFPISLTQGAWSSVRFPLQPETHIPQRDIFHIQYSHPCWVSRALRSRHELIVFTYWIFQLFP